MNHKNILTLLPPRILFGLSLVMGIFLSSCAETRSSQCQKIIILTKKIAQESQSYRQTEDMEKVLQFADAFEDAANNMDSLEIKDQQLNQYKQRFSQVYRGNAKATREFIDALQKKDIPNARLRQQQLKQIGKNERQLIGEINQYCQGN